METTTKPRTWALPAEPEGVTHVRDADGWEWKITDDLAIGGGQHRWSTTHDPDEDGPLVVPWKALLRFGPLTEVTN